MKNIFHGLIIRPLLLLLTIVSVQAHAADPSLTGGQTIPIQNSNSECVVPSKSTVSITVTSVRVPTNAGWPTWLKHTKAMGAKVDLSIDGPSGTSKHASFPVGKLVTQIVPDNSAAVIRATINIPVLTKYKLFDKDGNFAHVDMPLTLVKIDDNKGMKSLIDALTKVTLAIKLPPSPFEPGVAAFGSFVSDMFTADADPTNTYPNAILGFELIDDEAECATNGQALRSGAQAQIFTSPNNGDGIIDISNYAKYCYYSSGGADPNILYSDRPNNGVCPAGAIASAKTLNNPQVIFVVNSYPIAAIGKPASVTVTPNTLASFQYFSTDSKDSKDEFVTFAKSTQDKTQISTQHVMSDDLTSLHSKVNAMATAHAGKNFTIDLTPADRGVLTLTRALKNCTLVGLDAKNCN